MNQKNKGILITSSTMEASYFTLTYRPFQAVSLYSLYNINLSIRPQGQALIFEAEFRLTNDLMLGKLLLNHCLPFPCFFLSTYFTKLAAKDHTRRAAY